MHRFPQQARRVARGLAPSLACLIAAGTLAGCFLIPNVPPVCEMTVDPLSGHAPLVVRFDASTSNDDDGVVIAYNWSFGDGLAANGPTVDHTFAIPGTYAVELTLRDEDGAEATTTVDVVVEQPNAPPTALFTVTPTAAAVGETITFDASASFDSDGSIASYLWDFGDDETGSGIRATHVYTSDEIYTATLTVTDDDGATASATRFTLVAASAQPDRPIAVFVPTSAAVDVGDTVQFDASASSSPNGRILTYAWEFGDGAEAVGIVAGHTFAAAGAHTVRLTVTDEAGVSASAVGSVHVGVEPPTGGETITRSFWWEYAGRSRSLLVSLPKDLVDWATSQPRGAWPQRDYDEYVLNPLDDGLMIEIATALRLGSYRETVENALAFVQMGIAYQPDPGVFEYPRYPVETLHDEIGDCEDTAILYASLIRTLGHGALLVAVDTNGDVTADHMVVFVPIDDTFPTCGMDCVWEYDGRLYAMAETAVDGGPLPLGQDPWGLESGDIRETWDVSRVNRTPQMTKRVLRPEPEG